jgi:hypothetical protein
MPDGVLNEKIGCIKVNVARDSGLPAPMTHRLRGLNVAERLDSSASFASRHNKVTLR